MDDTKDRQTQSVPPSSDATGIMEERDDLSVASNDLDDEASVDISAVPNVVSGAAVGHNFRGIDPATMEKLKKKLLKIFHNDSILADIPLRVRMQSHGGWIAFQHLTCYKSLAKIHPDPQTWDQAIHELTDFFEVKDKKFRRKEPLPNLEAQIYGQSLLLIAENGGVEYPFVKNLMRDLMRTKNTFKGSHYRFIRPGENFYARDIVHLIYQCGAALQKKTFVWVELKANKPVEEAKDHFLEVINKAGSAPAPKFSVERLSEFVAKHHSSQRNQLDSGQMGQRKRGITLATPEESRCHNNNQMANNRNARFQFQTARRRADSTSEATGEGDGPATVGTTLSKSPNSGSNRALDTVPHSEVNRQRAAHLLPLGTHQYQHQFNNNWTSPASSSGGFKRRSRLAQSESDSGGFGLVSHVVDGERPQFITRRPVLVPNSKESGQLETSPGQEQLPGLVMVKLCRQPRGPVPQENFNLDKLLATLAV